LRFRPSEGIAKVVSAITSIIKAKEKASVEAVERVAALVAKVVKRLPVAVVDRQSRYYRSSDKNNM
jgi:hypothetical protein